MTGTAAQARRWHGPALLGFGFRPFFLLAGIWAILAMALWLGWLTGRIGAWPLAGGAFSALDWHVHALLFGYVPAVVAGFLLTAVPNWTGRLPVVGWPLAGLVALWLLGRIATTVPTAMPAGGVVVADLTFLAVFSGLIAREIVAGRNWRNLKVLVPLAVLLTGQALFHAETAHGMAAQGWGMRIALAATLFLILLIGGRIVPSFTRNWLVRHRPGPLPTAFSRFDALALAVAVAALTLWVLRPSAPESGVFALVAGILNALRLARWRGWRSLGEPLVAILHLGWAFVPLGFMLLALALLWPATLTMSAALHGWTTGAIGVMTLAVMTRATLGHSGHSLSAGAGTTALYALIALAALARVGAGLRPDWPLAEVAALAWIAAFAAFVAIYGPLLMTRRERRAD